jgi:hypothetical protein
VLLTRAAYHAAVRLLWLVVCCTTTAAKINCYMLLLLLLARLYRQWSQLSRPDKITQARFHLPKAPVLLLLGLTVRTPPQAGKDCVRDQGPMILVPGSSKYSTIKCLSA